MGRVEAFQVPGCTCVFYSNDHPPPHFHVSRPGEWGMRVLFLEQPPRCEVEFEVRAVPARLRRRIQALAAEHRLELFEEWERKVDSVR
ncbi:MAG: DUF4160 domain-containing protein [Acidobacteriota bacterium]